MKVLDRFYVPRDKKRKAWQWDLAHREGGIRVAVINGMHGGLIRDKVYKRMPWGARAYCTRYSYGLRWEMTH